MRAFLSTYNEAIGMAPVSVITTIFGAFCIAFVVIVCWGKLVEDFGPAGGMLCAAIIIGTFWVMNHKLPGFGINPGITAGSGGRPKTIRPYLPGLPRSRAVGGHGHGGGRRFVGAWLADGAARPARRSGQGKFSASAGSPHRRGHWRRHGGTGRLDRSESLRLQITRGAHHAAISSRARLGHQRQ